MPSPYLGNCYGEINRLITRPLMGWATTVIWNVGHWQ